MIEITSAANKKIKEVIALNTKAKIRKKEGAFIVEGIRMTREIPENLLRELYLTPAMAASKEGKEVLSALPICPTYLVAEDVFLKMSDTKTPQGILAVVEGKNTSLLDFEKDMDPKGTYLVLENLQDPGNLGTILRSSEAAGVSGIFLSQDSVELYNSKVVRSTMGAIFRVPVVTCRIQEVMELFRKKMIPTYAAHLDGKKNYDEFDYTGGAAFLIGNEGNGLRQETASMADHYLLIPMEGKVESLNASVAASLLVYEAKRQRDHR